VTVIGARGSGKTALADLIALAADARGQEASTGVVRSAMAISSSEQEEDEHLAAQPRAAGGVEARGLRFGRARVTDGLRLLTFAAQRRRCMFYTVYFFRRRP
jgi:hypothetical protein